MHHKTDQRDFLSRFLRQLGEKAFTQSDMKALQTRKEEGYARGEPLQKKLRRQPIYDCICFLVGDTLLHRNFSQDMKAVDVDVRMVALPADVITHSGVALASVLAAVESGLLAQVLDIRLSREMTYHVVHCEGQFHGFPIWDDLCHIAVSDWLASRLAGRLAG